MQICMMYFRISERILRLTLYFVCFCTVTLDIFVAVCTQVFQIYTHVSNLHFCYMNMKTTLLFSQSELNSFFKCIIMAKQK